MDSVNKMDLSWMHPAERTAFIARQQDRNKATLMKMQQTWNKYYMLSSGPKGQTDLFKDVDFTEKMDFWVDHNADAFKYTFAPFTSHHGYQQYSYDEYIDHLSRGGHYSLTDNQKLYLKKMDTFLKSYGWQGFFKQDWIEPLRLDAGPAVAPDPDKEARDHTGAGHWQKDLYDILEKDQQDLHDDLQKEFDTWKQYHEANKTEAGNYNTAPIPGEYDGDGNFTPYAHGSKEYNNWLYSKIGHTGTHTHTHTHIHTHTKFMMLHLKQQYDGAI
jgi:hypothetical protein